ncbi:hypothetical protein, partial [Bacteroides caecimuris]|uniref:hypothetical protein n=1 Tax=Bacteroides caecimuris TaxID=1796613 RepID=UPI0025706196
CKNAILQRKSEFSDGLGGGETGGYTLFCQDVQEMFQMYDSALVVRHLLLSLQQMFHPSYAFSVKKTIFVAI